MAYADQSMSGSRLTALIIVALLHVVLIYGLVTGLAYEGVKKAIKRVTTVDIEEEVKEEEPPPPPPEKDLPPPPPIVAPPPKIDLAPAPAKVTVVKEAPPPPPPTRPAEPRNAPGSWATDNDYPSRAMREEREGTTTFSVTIDDNGRVASCRIVSSSGHADLDEATCKNVTRRARFRKPSDGYGDTYTNRIRWVIPD